MCSFLEKQADPLLDQQPGGLPDRAFVLYLMHALLSFAGCAVRLRSYSRHSESSLGGLLLNSAYALGSGSERS